MQRFGASIYRCQDFAGRTKLTRSASKTSRSREAKQDAASLPKIWHLFSDDGLPQRLLLLAKMIERQTARQLQADFDLSLAQWRVLAFVCIAGPSTASFMGEAAEVDQAEISRAVRALLDKKLIVREFQPGNRKTMVIAPTEQGLAQFKLIRELRQRYFALITSKLSSEQRATVNVALSSMAEDVVVERTTAR
ncbi:MarR family transcriptional regulator [Croceibacterium sp. LX-88]|uniref:MarR family transcriptional regulator n=1 Tax=Croceibacterium selenioxidans TaxID=2838833 RepID=A0ABS5W7Y6_9SPHN|nr:MarR family transcriptional regulator [Croceibacterium selenioxidans]MBT2134499.1 MarR family transcriptional regulator [Croceibacterium selenioxidans]